MKKLKLIKVIYILLLVCIFVPDAFSQPKIYITLINPPLNQLSSGDLWNMTLDNRTNSSLNIYLEGYGDEQTKGRIVEGRSATINLPPGRSNYNYRTFENGTVTWRDNKMKEFILRTGTVQAGIYKICVTAYSADSGNVVGMETCITQQIIRNPVAEINLISPSNGDSISQPYITFNWSGAALIPGNAHRFIIREMLNNQPCEQAFQSGRIIFQQANIRTTFFKYPESAAPLEPGKRYAWRILLERDTGIIMASPCGYFEVKYPKSNICSLLKVNIKKDSLNLDSCSYNIKLTNNLPRILSKFVFSFQITTSATISSIKNNAAGWSQTLTSGSQRIITWKKSNKKISRGNIDLADIYISSEGQSYLVYSWLDNKGRVVCKDSVKIDCGIIKDTCKQNIYSIQILNKIDPVRYSKIRVVSESDTKIIDGYGDDWIQIIQSPNSITWYPESDDEIDADIESAGQGELLDNEFFVNLDPDIAGTLQNFRVEFLDIDDNIICSQKISIPNKINIDYEDEKWEDQDWTKNTILNNNSCSNEVLAVAVPWDCEDYEEVKSNYKTNGGECRITKNISCLGNEKYEVKLSTSAVTSGIYKWSYVDDNGSTLSASTQDISFTVSYGYNRNASLIISTKDKDNNIVEYCNSDVDIDLNFGILTISKEQKDCNPLEIVLSAENMDWDLITSYDWKEQGISIGTTKVITHTFSNYGSYIIRLDVTDIYGCIHSKEITLNLIKGCYPSFTFIYDMCKTSSDGGYSYNSPTSAEVTFKNTSEGGDCNTIYEWDFGDGQTKTVDNKTADVKHSYHQLSSISPFTIKKVKLTMKNGTTSNDGACDNIGKNDSRDIVFKPCFIDFTIDTCKSGEVFFRTKENYPGDIYWDFPRHKLFDGNLKYNLNNKFIQKHEYNDGSYNATLTVVSPEGCRCIKTKSFSVNASECCSKKKVKNKSKQQFKIGNKNIVWKCKFKAKGKSNKIVSTSRVYRRYANSFLGNVLVYKDRVTSNTIKIKGSLSNENKDSCSCTSKSSYEIEKRDNPSARNTKWKHKPALRINGLKKDWRINYHDLKAEFTLNLNNVTPSVREITLYLAESCEK